MSKAVLHATTDGQSNREISETLGIPWSIANDIWNKAG
jgi:hypothetical protein